MRTPVQNTKVGFYPKKSIRHSLSRPAQEGYQNGNFNGWQCTAQNFTSTKIFKIASNSPLPQILYIIQLDYIFQYCQTLKPPGPPFSKILKADENIILHGKTLLALPYCRRLNSKEKDKRECRISQVKGTETLWLARMYRIIDEPLCRYYRCTTMNSPGRGLLVKRCCGYYRYCET